MIPPGQSGRSSVIAESAALVGVRVCACYNVKPPVVLEQDQGRTAAMLPLCTLHSHRYRSAHAPRRALFTSSGLYLCTGRANVSPIGYAENNDNRRDVKTIASQTSDKISK
ncbi:hypothetical protein J6590_025075 [Homalodisca vitripennis]|nr:hypothetical protein J6590_025075 [Homalodisca vitripennis]